MTFTNRVGQDIFIKLSTEDEPKVLRASDSRMSFVCRGAGGPEKLQVTYSYLIYVYNNWSHLIKSCVILIHKLDNNLQGMVNTVQIYG